MQPAYAAVMKVSRALAPSEVAARIWASNPTSAVEPPTKVRRGGLLARDVRAVVQRADLGEARGVETRGHAAAP
jgi:hypothetical protein